MLSWRLLSPMVLLEAVWLESQASVAKVVEGDESQKGPEKVEGHPFFPSLGWLWTLMALKALWRGSGRPSWRLLVRPTCSARKKALSIARLRCRGGPVWPAPNECSRRGEHGL